MTPTRAHPLGRRMIRRLIHFLAFGFGVGHLPLAPGSWGTLVAVPIYLLLRETGITVYVTTVVVLFALGVWLCDVTERDSGAADAPEIVWDEIVGYLIAMTAAPMAWQWIVAGFILFRLFDIVKPFPIRAIEQRVSGGFGVMLDDALAGFYVLALLQLASLLLA